jgi:glycosyltransferase involved in cell wall biosynthesis
MHRGPIVFEVHRLPTRRSMLWAYKSIVRSDGVCIATPCESDRADLLRRLPSLDSTRTAVLHLAADETKPGQTPPAGWPGRTGALQVGYVGSMKPWKGLGIVVEIARRAPDIDVHLIGQVTDHVPTQRPPNLHVHGFIPPARIGGHIAALDCALVPQLPYASEGRAPNFPTKVIEYMAHAKAIVALDIPTIREALDERTGVLVSQDPDAWVGALRELAGDPERRRRLGAAAERAFHCGYTWRHRAERLLALGGLSSVT